LTDTINSGNFLHYSTRQADKIPDKDGAGGANENRRHKRQNWSAEPTQVGLVTLSCKGN